MFATLHDAGRRDNQYASIGRVNHSKRVALLHALKQRCGGPGPCYGAFTCVQHRDRVVDRTSDPWIVFRQLFKELPAVLIAQCQRPGSDVAAEAGVTQCNVVIPSWVEEVSPVLGGVGFLK